MFLYFWGLALGLSLSLTSKKEKAEEARNKHDFTPEQLRHRGRAIMWLSVMAAIVLVGIKLARFLPRDPIGDHSLGQALQGFNDMLMQFMDALFPVFVVFSSIALVGGFLMWWPNRKEREHKRTHPFVP